MPSITLKILFWFWVLSPPEYCAKTTSPTKADVDTTDSVTLMSRLTHFVLPPFYSSLLFKHRHCWRFEEVCFRLSVCVCSRQVVHLCMDTCLQIRVFYTNILYVTRSMLRSSRSRLLVTLRWAHVWYAALSVCQALTIFSLSYIFHLLWLSVVYLSRWWQVHTCVLVHLLLSPYVRSST